MGEVYHAWDKTLGGRGARRSFGREWRSARPTSTRWRNASSATSAGASGHPPARHPHPRPGEVNGLKYLTMEFGEGADLSLLLKRQGKMTVGRALAVARQVDRCWRRPRGGHRSPRPQARQRDSRRGGTRAADRLGIARAVDAPTSIRFPDRCRRARVHGPGAGARRRRRSAERHLRTRSDFYDSCLRPSAGEVGRSLSA